MQQSAKNRFEGRIKDQSWIALIIVAFVWSAYSVGLNPVFILEGLPNLADFVVGMFPPDLAIFERLVQPAVETAQMAFVGTILATVMALPLSFLAARNITPNKALYALARAITVMGRSIPDILFALIFVAAVGLGALPGTIALALHSIGMLGKMFADFIEEIDEGQLEAIKSTGAGKWQQIRFGIMPQILPAVVGVVLYRLDLNMRSSVVLGLVGAGGIGYELLLSMRLFHYQEIFSIIIVIFLMVIGVEYVSSRIRSRIIAGDVKKHELVVLEQ